MMRLLFAFAGAGWSLATAYGLPPWAGPSLADATTAAMCGVIVGALIGDWIERP